MEQLIKFLNILEGFKTRIKNLHWAAEAMNIHVRLDELLDVVSGYQDALAEETMGIHGRMQPMDITGEPCNVAEPNAMLANLKMQTENFYARLSDDLELAGIRSETETFIHDLNKYVYLFSLCKG